MPNKKSSGLTDYTRYAAVRCVQNTRKRACAEFRRDKNMKKKAKMQVECKRTVEKES